jgi:hypothetical protein
LLLILIALLSYLTLAAHFVLGITTFTPAALVFSLLGFLQFFTILTNLLLACALPLTLSTRNRSAHSLGPRSPPRWPSTPWSCSLFTPATSAGNGTPPASNSPSTSRFTTSSPSPTFSSGSKKIPKGSLHYKDALPWLLFPLAFLPWNALCSHLLHNNPYPFLDPARITYPGLVLSILSLLALFLLLSLAFIKLDRRLAGNH